MTQKRIYQLDDAGVWDGLEKFARPDPMNDGEFLIPAQCTDLPPPEAGNNQAARFVGGGWLLIPDYRGYTYWLADRSSVTINQVGIEPPPGALDADPGPTSEDIKRARIVDINQSLSGIASQKIDALTDAVLLGDKTRLQALEDQAATLRAELATL